MYTSSTNGVILASIPLNRKMKGYWQRKYERIVRNNGADEAVAKFKNLRVQVLSYLSSPNRRANLDTFLTSTGFRNNGYLRMLFEYAECQPHFVLSFLKLYTGPVKSSKTADQAAYETRRRLEHVRANTAVPRYLRDWLKCINTRHGLSYQRALRDQNDTFHRLALNLGSYESWHGYWSRWYSVLRRGWQSSSSLDYKPVWPEIYKDYASLDMDSRTYRRDFACLVSMHMTEDSCLSHEELDFVDEFLSEEVGDALYAVLWGDDPSNQDLSGIFQESELYDGQFIGYLHHIHKKGGGTDLRDIAVPNRFVQNALVPAADRLYNLVRQLPKDATFDQDKFDTRIQNRVNNDNLYQGSVDLSKATDNLPFSWGDEIVSELLRIFGPTPEDKMLKAIFDHFLTPEGEEKEKAETRFVRSYNLFRTVARAKWLDEGFLTEWKVGQPLGSLPSFAMLAITHNLLLESLGASLGLKHSPYVVLGDDVVIMNKRLRKRYIRELSSRGIPLSLHKSYEGRLSEFAGKTYVKNSVPFYCSDHNPVTWNSLFDWQRTTGIRIPWNNLPRSIKTKVFKVVRETCADEHPSTRRVIQLAKLSYDLVQICEVYGRGTHIYPIGDSAELSERIVGYFCNRISEKSVPDPVKHTGISILANGHPVVLMSNEFADKDGYFQRFRPVELPAWYREKVRPVATDAAIAAACKACRSETAS